TCANRGCDPKKVLVGAAEVMDQVNRMRGVGIEGDSKVDWSKLMAFKNTFTKERPKSTEKGLAAAGIDAYHGVASFESEDSIRVADNHLSAKYIMIASGSRPMPLGIDGEEFITYSNDFLDLEELPEQILFVGGGFISFEFAHVCARSGSKVHIMERGSRPLKNFDADMVEVLTQKTRDIGIELYLQTQVVSIEPRGDKFLVKGIGNGEQVTCECDLVVHGAGRIPALYNMELNKGNVEQSKHGVVVNEFLQSVSNPKVYSAGDAAATDGLPLTPIAGMEAAIVASNLLNGNHATASYKAVPSVVYSVPKVAAVGLSAEQAADAGIECEVKTTDTSGWYTSRRTNDGYSKIKTLVDKKTNRIVGAHAVGNYADELINIFTMAIAFDIAADDIKKMIFAYPSVGSDIHYMI
ncbi:MAG: NAD(P)/FAD-dependent oxidoreductase, partial [Clostridia bacterium]|nr:NAD(P)/FAD-dependent oxidoreductase [Clostridia bacterium]